MHSAIPVVSAAASFIVFALLTMGVEDNLISRALGFVGWLVACFLLLAPH